MIFTLLTIKEYIKVSKTKFILMSATLNINQFLKYFNYKPSPYNIGYI